ncbi:hypothetical protein [Gordonia sp. (in: high G+C Gram-positive bacteria)]|uniref:hypothetical protein n=1 Tax=Gordonia sp. (in: high G+C Gram-positive bacteria) TaxID=84139 RepID=UPI002603CFB7|nr:hypothetical protein [Gordonia sp. (in: high G+C Gram-positive bacteria)]
MNPEVSQPVCAFCCMNADQTRFYGDMHNTIDPVCCGNTIPEGPTETDDYLAVVAAIAGRRIGEHVAAGGPDQFGTLADMPLIGGVA